MIVVLILLCAGLLTGAEIVRSACCLTVSHYALRSGKVTRQLRVLQLSDLHNAQHGSENRRLLRLAAEQAPDLILFTGDLVTGTDPDTGVAVSLLERLTDIAPVYVSLGNHERMYMNRYETDLTALFEKTGAHVLEYEYEDILIRGQESDLPTGEAREPECAFLREFQDTSRCTLLMAHIPAGWLRSRGLEEWNIDLVFSGHAHGGQVVLPLIGGVYAPDMGFFPGRLEGLFPAENGSKALVLSSGLGNTEMIPRFGNPPQILVLDILPTE